MSHVVLQGHQSERNNSRSLSNLARPVNIVHKQEAHGHYGSAEMDASLGMYCTHLFLFSHDLLVKSDKTRIFHTGFSSHLVNTVRMRIPRP